MTRTLSVGLKAHNAEIGGAYFLSSLRNAPITKATSATRSSSFFFTEGKLAEVSGFRAKKPLTGYFADGFARAATCRVRLMHRCSPCHRGVRCRTSGPVVGAMTGRRRQ